MLRFGGSGFEGIGARGSASAVATASGGDVAAASTGAG